MTELDLAIRFYKEIRVDIDTLSTQAEGVLEKIEQLMGDTLRYECEFGVVSKSPELDKIKWYEAIMDDPDLFAVQAHFDKAEKLLRESQKPYMKEVVRIE